MGWGGEVPRIEVSPAAIALAGGVDSFCNDVVVPLVAPYGGGLLKFTDCELEKISPSTQLDLQAQRVSCNKDHSELRFLIKGKVRQESLKHYQDQHDTGLDGAESLTGAVTDGLDFYQNVGEQGEGQPTWYASDSGGKKAGAGKKGGKSVGQLFIDNLRFLFHFAYVLIGITVGMFYVGYRNTIAAFHCEDAQLESLNYLFDGDAKQWLILPGLWSAPLLDYLRRRSLLNAFFNKELVLPTSLLDRLGVTYYTATQLPGWFVITTGFHQVRNSGFNIAYAVNFPVPRSLFRYLRAAEHLRQVTLENPETARAQVPVLRLALDFLCSERKRAGVCSHAVEYLWNLLGEINQTLHETPLEKSQQPENRYPPKEKGAEYNTWAYKYESGQLRHSTCKICGSDTCFAAVDLRGPSVGCLKCLTEGKLEEEQKLGILVFPELEQFKEALQLVNPAPCKDCRIEGLGASDEELAELRKPSEAPPGNRVYKDCLEERGLTGTLTLSQAGTLKVGKTEVTRELAEGAYTASSAGAAQRAEAQGLQRCPLNGQLNPPSPVLEHLYWGREPELEELLADREGGSWDCEQAAADLLSLHQSSPLPPNLSAPPTTPSVLVSPPAPLSPAEPPPSPRPTQSGPSCSDPPAHSSSSLRKPPGASRARDESEEGGGRAGKRQKRPTSRKEWTPEEAREQEWPEDIPPAKDRFWKLAGFRPGWSAGYWRMRVNKGNGQTSTIAKSVDFRTAYQAAKEKVK